MAKELENLPFEIVRRGKVIAVVYTKDAKPESNVYTLNQEPVRSYSKAYQLRKTK